MYGNPAAVLVAEGPGVSDENSAEVSSEPSGVSPPLAPDGTGESTPVLGGAPVNSASVAPPGWPAQTGPPNILQNRCLGGVCDESPPQLALPTFSGPFEKAEAQRVAELEQDVGAAKTIGVLILTLPTAGAGAFAAGADIGGIDAATAAARWFSPTTNAAGGEVWTSIEEITQDDFAVIVERGLEKGEVNIITGTHGAESGATSVDEFLLKEDVERFGNMPGVKIHNFPEMSPEELGKVLNGPGTTIGAFCYSGVCLAPFW
jgi:hypothetical protein